jgi:hypothetical protein
MINTSCFGCLFAEKNDNRCYFGIPEIIKDTKKIIEKNNSLYIEDYSCRYCLSEEAYKENEDFKKIDIVQYVLQNSKIKYYLIINLENHLDELPDIISGLSGLDIKPQFISFINKSKNKSKYIAEYIQKNLKIDSRWKLHNFIIESTLQECITISLDTNIQKSDANIFMVYDPPKNEPINLELLNDRVNHLQIECVVKQTKFNAIIKHSEILDGLTMSFKAYKFLLLNINKNIFEAIKQQPEFTCIYYDE